MLIDAVIRSQLQVAHTHASSNSQRKTGPLLFELSICSPIHSEFQKPIVWEFSTCYYPYRCTFHHNLLHFLAISAPKVPSNSVLIATEFANPTWKKQNLFQLSFYMVDLLQILTFLSFYLAHIIIVGTAFRMILPLFRKLPTSKQSPTMSKTRLNNTIKFL